MSTRSAIIEKGGDGLYRGIYCHSDGYLEGVGATLLAHYTEPAKVSRLIALGDISSLGERVEPFLPNRHSFQRQEEGTTVAYHRDRGEERRISCGSTVAEVEATIDHNGHVYVFDGRWTHNGQDLAAALAPEAVTLTREEAALVGRGLAFLLRRQSPRALFTPADLTALCTLRDRLCAGEDE